MTSVLVLGAGFGGLELSTRLSEELGDAVEITLIDRNDAFVFGFSKLDVMFGTKPIESVRLRYEDITTPQVRFRQETITAIDPQARRVTTDLDTYEADVLVIALGADFDMAATPGLAEAGNEFYTVAGAETLRDVLPTFTSGTAIVGVCGAPFKCPPAPSEAAILLDEYLRERGVRDAVRIQVVIPFGVAGATVARDLRRRSCAVRRARDRVRAGSQGGWHSRPATPCCRTARVCRTTSSWGSPCTGSPTWWRPRA